MSDAPAPATWTFCDAWLLTAIASFERHGCTLTEMIGVADALDHSIPNESEAAVSLGRLAASGLITASAERIRATASGRAVYEQRKGGMFEQSGSLLTALGATECRDGEFAFAPGEFRAAYEDYLRR